MQTGAVPEEQAWGYTNDIMLVTVHIANRDVSDITKKGNFARGIHNGRGVKAEEVPELRKNVTNARELARAASLQRSAPLLYGWLGGEYGNAAGVPPENVPHMYIPRDDDGVMYDFPGHGKEYPPYGTYVEAVMNTQDNCRSAGMYYIAQNVSHSLVAAFGAAVDEPDARVPGIVHSVDWPMEAVAPIIELSPEDQAIYQELFYGKGQQAIDIATPRRSPIGGVIFGMLGSDGTRELSDIVQRISADALADGNPDPFCDKAIAEHYISIVRQRIGEEAFGVIIEQMRRAAVHYQDDPERGNPERAAKIAALAADPG
jgi:hypothetical protein